MASRSVIVPDNLDGQRLDVVVAALTTGLTRSAARRLIDDGHVAVSYGNARPARLVAGGDTVTIDVPERSPLQLVPTSGGLSIVYEDDDLIVVDKPARLTVHPGAGRDEDTVVHRLLGYDPSVSGGDAERPGIVHRLDRDTSGLLVIARTPAAHAVLARQWREREVIKRYLALVEGVPRQPEGVIEMPIGRDPRHRTRMAPIAGGRPAWTHYRESRRFARFTLLDIAIETGRTHQIRVHLAALGHPVAGDRLYGAKQQLPGLTRQFLHAYLLGLYLPTSGIYREFTSALPPDLTAVLATLA